MSTPPQSPPEPEARIEYDRLIEYFKWLVGASITAITIIAGVATAFLFHSTGEVRTEAETSIKRTEDSANRQISEIAKSATDTARAEAQKAIETAFEKQNVQRMIENTAQKRVDTAVEVAVQKNLGARIEAFQNLIGEIGEISNAGAQLRQNFGEGLETLLKKRESQNQTVKAYASSTLTEIAADYESSITHSIPYRPEPNSFLLGNLPPKTLMAILGHATGQFAPQQIAEAFLDMKKRVHWDVPMFDIPAAEKWCAQHKPKCEE